MTAIFVFIILAKVVAAAKEILVAWRYGTGAAVDAYLFAFNIVNIPIAVSYSVMAVVLIPLHTRLASVSEVEARRFVSELTGATLVVSLLLATLIWLGLRGLFLATSLGLERDTYLLAIDAVDLLVLLIPLGLMANAGSVLLMARRQHVNSLLEGAPALGLALVLLVWKGGLPVLLWGTLAGGVLHLALTVGALGRRQILPVPRLRFGSPAWSDFRVGIGAMFLAQMFLAMTAVVDQLFAADLGSGSIARLGYATRILSLFLTLGAATITRAMLPAFSRIGHDDPNSLPRLAVHWGGWCFIAGLAAATSGWIVAEWLVATLFERGAFTNTDTLAVAGVLRWALLQLPFYFSLMAVQQALFSSSRYRLAVYLAVMTLAVKLVGSFLLTPMFGLPGLMAASAIMYATASGVMTFAVLRMPRVFTVEQT